MLRSVRELYGYVIRALDGDIGTVRDFYFGDRDWVVRYLVADTGNWLVDRLVLLSTVSLGQPDWERHEFPVRLTKEQVEHSPAVDAAEPVSRRMEEELHEYYGWPFYWSGAGAAMAMTAERMAAREEHAAIEGPGSGQHLRSTQEVMGYHIQANDGEVGWVKDFIADDGTWLLNYMVVDTGGWLSGRSVLLAPAWVKEVNWAENKVHVDLHRETIENSPPFDPSVPVNREYELRLYDYYGRPKYWTQVERE